MLHKVTLSYYICCFAKIPIDRYLCLVGNNTVINICTNIVAMTHFLVRQQGCNKCGKIKTGFIVGK